MKHKHVNKEQHDFLVKIAATDGGITYQEMVEAFNIKFKSNRDVFFAANYCRRKDIKKTHKPSNSAFKKGMIPWNKGVKNSTGHSKSRFKKGHKANCQPIGSTRISSKTGTIQIKVSQPAHWREISHIEWEKHNPPMKKGEIICYLDGNVNNYQIDNLMCVTRQELGSTMNEGVGDMTAEQKKATLLIAKIKMRVRD